jgi:hypothetical protein
MKKQKENIIEYSLTFSGMLIALLEEILPELKMKLTFEEWNELHKLQDDFDKEHEKFVEYIKKKYPNKYAEIMNSENKGYVI